MGDAMTQKIIVLLGYVGEPDSAAAYLRDVADHVGDARIWDRSDSGCDDYLRVERFSDDNWLLGGAMHAVEDENGLIVALFRKPSDANDFCRRDPAFRVVAAELVASVASAAQKPSLDSVRATSRYLSSADVARLCEVDVKTIHNWVSKQQIEHFRTPGGHLRFKTDDVVYFLRKCGYDVPANLSTKRDKE
jgi:hypothetical protein